MKIEYAEQHVSGDESITYEHKDDVLTVTMFFEGEEYKDTFDFSGFTEDGELRMFDGLGERTIQTSLPENPIISVKRVDGVLHLMILKWISIEPHEEPEEDIDDGKD